jgi:cysteine desulfurase/selenocysteine lyase
LRKETYMNIDKIRKDFPQLNSTVNNNPLVYLDNAATTLKPQCMIDTISKYYSSEVANVHRGIHTLSEVGTKRFEETRIAVQEFINARNSNEIIYTKGTTDSLNLLANSFGKKYLTPGDIILVSTLEHHSNIVPWQMIAEVTGAKVIEVPINDQGEIIQSEYKKLLNERVKIVSIAHISNTLGTINPIKEMVSEAHEIGAKFCVDAAQSAAHLAIDVQDLDCDFLAFSAHKLFGPNGLGFLYGKAELLNEMPPYQGGGAMISEVNFLKTTYNILPNKFEAGTPAIAEVIAFNSSLKYVAEIGLNAICEREHQLLKYATDKILKIPGIRIIGEAKNKSSVLSFHLDGCHPQDIGTLLDQQGIAIRTGHHCTQPLMKRMNISAAARASFSFYNTEAEIDIFINGLLKAINFLK